MTGNLDWLAHRTCSSCGTQPVGPGGILCSTCRTKLETANTTRAEPASDPQRTTQSEPVRATEPPVELIDDHPDSGHLPI